MKTDSVKLKPTNIISFLPYLSKARYDKRKTIVTKAHGLIPSIRPAERTAVQLILSKRLVIPLSAFRRSSLVNSGVGVLSAISIAFTTLPTMSRFLKAFSPMNDSLRSLCAPCNIYAHNDYSNECKNIYYRPI